MDWAEHFTTQHHKQTPYDSISQVEAEVDMGLAYKIQQAFVQRMGLPVAGYKAALTAPAAQAAMGADQAIAGVLYEAGHFAAGHLDLSQPCMLETEIGFTAATQVTQPVSATDVFSHMTTCHPMIEVASPNLAGKPNGIDLVATNAASFGYIKGPAHPIREDLDEITIEFEVDGETLHTARAGDVMGSQANALAWLVNLLLELGYTIQPGHLFMTGSIGAMHPAKPGQYKASYGSLGQIEFAI